MLGDFGVGVKDEVTSNQHVPCEGTHDGFGLNMKVPKHLIGAPTTQEANEVAVDMGAKKGHRARSTEAASRNVFNQETKVGGSQGSDSSAKDVGNVGG